MEQTVFSSRSRPPLAPQGTSSSPRSVPRNLDLRPADSAAIANDWINDLSLGLQQICGSPPSIMPSGGDVGPLLVSVGRHGGGSGSVSSNSSSGGLDARGRQSPLTPPSASPSSHSYRPPVSTPTKSPSIASGLVSPVFAALTPVYCDCSQSPQQQVRQHRRSTPSPPVMIGLPSIPEPTAAVSTSTAAPIVSRSRRAENGVFQRTFSLVGARGTPNSALRSRPVIVRHVETRERLDKQLSSICGGRTSVSSSPVAALTQPETTHPGVLLYVSEMSHRQHRSASSSIVHRMDAGSLNCGGVKLRVNIAPYQPEDLVVSVSPSGAQGRKAVDVEAIQGLDFSTLRLHHSDLLLSPDCVNHLMCHVTSGGWMYIREHRSATFDTSDNDKTGSGGNVASDDDVLSVDYGAREQSFVPVMYCNEDRLELTFVVHLPECFRFEDVGVKTVDDRVVVTCGGGSTGGGSTGQTPSPNCKFLIDAHSRFASSSTESPPPRGDLRVVIPLPDGTDNRSVCASISAKNQLIIVARLGNDSWRRYTF